MGCRESRGVLPRPSAHHGVVLRMVWGKGERSGEAVSGCPRCSQKEKGRQEALLLCLPSGVPPGSCPCGAPQGSVSPAPADSSWGIVLTGGTWPMRVCELRGIAFAKGFPASRRGEQEEGSPDHCRLGLCSFLGSQDEEPEDMGEKIVGYFCCVSVTCLAKWR